MKRSWSRILALTMGIPMLLAILVACGSGTTSSGSSSTPTGSTTIKIATELPVSGKDESSGKPAENGAHLAVDEANSSNFLPVYTFIFVRKDDVGANGSHDPSTEKGNLNELVGDGLVAGVVA